MYERGGRSGNNSSSYGYRPMYEEDLMIKKDMGMMGDYNQRG